METRAFSPTKKRRADDFEASDSSTLQSPELWFTDGDIILQAETTQFRVHRERLALASPYFSENFVERGVGQMQGRRRISVIIVDGCPLVYVLEKAKEWSDLLMAVYNLFIDVYPIDRLLSLLRLGHKYRFDLYRDVAASRLRNTIPCQTLAEWDASGLCNPATGPLFNPAAAAGTGPSTQQPLFTSGYEFDLLNAALETGLQTLLPVAYFLCLRDQGEHRILDGVQHPDGTSTHLPRRIQHALIAARSELAHLAILHTELEPRRMLQEAYYTGTVVCEAPPVSVQVPVAMGVGMAESMDVPGQMEGQSQTISVTTTCAAYRSSSTDQRTLHLARAPTLSLSLSSLQSTTIHHEQEQHQLARCIPCSTFLSTQIQQGRAKIWDALPLVFGLPPRSQLVDAF